MTSNTNSIPFLSFTTTPSSSDSSNKMTSSTDGENVTIPENSLFHSKQNNSNKLNNEPIGSVSWNVTLTQPTKSNNNSRTLSRVPSSQNNSLKKNESENTNTKNNVSNFPLNISDMSIKNDNNNEISLNLSEQIDFDSKSGCCNVATQFSQSTYDGPFDTKRCYLKYKDSEPIVEFFTDDNNCSQKTNNFKPSLQSILEKHYSNGTDSNSFNLKSSSNYKNWKNNFFEPFGGFKYGWNFFSNGQTKIRYHIHEILMGLMISLTIVPELVAFSFIANVHPSIGLQGGYLLSIVIGILGGAPSVIHGPTGSLASIVSYFVEEKCSTNDYGIKECISHGLENVFVATAFASIIILFFSLFQLSSLVNLIPTSVTIGYCNGLALIIGLSQFHPFFDSTHKLITGSTLIWMLLHTVIAMLVMQFWPKIPKIGIILPAPLIAISISVLFEKFIIQMLFSNIFGVFFSTKTVGETAHFTIQNSYIYPVFLQSNYSFSNIHWDQSLVILTLYISVCALIEALVVLYVIRSLRDINVKGNQELFALSVGLFLSSFFGTLPGSSMLALTVMNYKAKGFGKESAVFAGVFTFIILMAGSSILNMIPLACLSGIMLIVVAHTFKWFSIPIILFSLFPKKLRKLHPIMKRKITRWDAVIIFIVSITCYLINVVVAVLIGISMSALVFAWEIRKQFQIITKVDEKNFLKFYEIEGPLFFASREKLEMHFTPESDPNTIIILLKGRTTLFDYSALDVLITIKRKYQLLGKKVEIKGLDSNTIKMFAKAEKLLEYVDYQMIEIDIPSVPKLYSPFKYSDFLSGTEEAFEKPENSSLQLL